MIDNKHDPVTKDQRWLKETIIKISAITSGYSSMEPPLAKLLKHTEFPSLEWINLDKQTVYFKTIH